MMESLDYILITLVLIILFVLLVYVCWKIATCLKIPYRRLSKISETEQANLFSGLENIGESCYMNSMVQALASSEKLISLYDKCTDENIRRFADLLKNINEPGSNSASNTALLQDLCTVVQWDRPSQQDTFQLLSFFINKIAKDMKEKFIIPPKFQLLHSFTEKALFNKIQDHLALAVPLCGTFKDPPGVPLDTLLDAFFLPSLIDDGPYATVMYIYGNAPEVLLLHIQANEWSNETGGYIKPEYHIIYGEILKYVFDIHNEVDGSSCKKINVSYQLTAVVHHMGNVTGGHYVTYRKYRNEWYLANDEQVKKVSFKCGIVPYVMVYEKVEE